MDHSSAVSGRANLQEIFRYQRQIAAQRSAPTNSAFPSASDPPPATGTSGAATAPAASSTPVGSARPLLSPTIAKLLLQLQDDANQTPAASSATASSAAAGTISQSDFEKAFTAQADQLFAKLDQNRDGTIDPAEARSALKHRSHHHHSEKAASAGSPAGTVSTTSTLIAAQQLGQAA